MTVLPEVLRVLDDVLGLKGRTASFDPATPLLGALPELDSMAVVALLTALENHFGVLFHDDQLQGSAFATVGALAELVSQALTNPA
jgi:acyl carrier protein